MAKRGGGIFTYVADPVTGATKFTTLSIVLMILLSIGILLAFVLPFILKKQPDNNKTYGGAVAPPMSQQPGRITIAEVAQGPSAGQAIIYFSKTEASGTTCDTCTAEFDININYVGGSPQQPPAFKKVTSSVLNGTVTFDYGSSPGGFSPLTPGGNNTIPPTKVDITINARSINPETGAEGGPTTFNKTLPYVA